MHFREGRVTRIVSRKSQRPLAAYKLEPELITNLFDSQRSKRWLVHFEDIPSRLVNAILATEDHRFL